VCRQIKADPKLIDIPIIMVTGLSSPEDRIKGIEVGVEDYFTKPINKTELLARIKILLKVKTLNDERRSAELQRETALAALKKSYDELDYQVQLRTAELAKANELLQADIAARKRTEAKYYDLYDNAPDMYYSVYLATGLIMECNESFERTTGYSREELMGRPIFELYDTGSADDAKKSFQQFPVTGEIHNAERRVKCKSGVRGLNLLRYNKRHFCTRS